MSLFRSINEAYEAAKRGIRDRLFILETTLEMEESLPGDIEGDELDSSLDIDSVPEDVYNKIDKVLDSYVNDPNYDDSEIGEMLAGDEGGEVGVGEDGVAVPDSEIDKAIDENAHEWIYGHSAA